LTQGPGHDETEFRNFIVQLEDQKIRHYKIEDRGNLRNIHSSDWPKFFEKYLRDNNTRWKSLTSPLT
uniref:RNA transcription, translation and transport factor protein n=1 Tax=Propithecus coquereli TaxID=379532 RepID=A0A2K6EWH7_PROCO